MNLVVIKHTDISARHKAGTFVIERLINMELGEEDIKHEYPHLIPDQAFRTEADCSEMLRSLIPNIQTIQYIDPETE